MYKAITRQSHIITYDVWPLAAPSPLPSPIVSSEGCGRNSCGYWLRFLCAQTAVPWFCLACVLRSFLDVSACSHARMLKPACLIGSESIGQLFTTRTFHFEKRLGLAGVVGPSEATKAAPSCYGWPSLALALPWLSYTTWPQNQVL